MENKEKKAYTAHAFGLTARGTVFGITGMKTYGEDRYVNATIALNGASYALKQLTGHEFPKDETVFCRLSFKNFNADRLIQVASGRDRMYLCVGGKVELNSYEKDGMTVIDGVRMYVNGFWEAAACGKKADELPVTKGSAADFF